jgi:hypothetical protein
MAMFSKLFYVFAIFMGLFASVVSYAQEEMDLANHTVVDPVNSRDTTTFVPTSASLDSTRSAKYGVLGNIGRSVTAGGSTPAAGFQLNDGDLGSLTGGSVEAARERNELLGCSTMDYHASMITSLNNNETDIEEYVDSPMGTFMLTTLLNSPAIAATFNSVEAFGAKRVQLMQDRCQAMQSDATVSAEGMMRWQALQACVAANTEAAAGGSTGVSSMNRRSDSEAVAVAMAYRACLYGSQGQEDRFGTDPIEAFGASVSPGSVAASLEGAMKEDVLEFDGDTPSLWTGTLFHALRNTAFCEMDGAESGDSPDVDTTLAHHCSIMAMIPNVRWCAGSEMMDRSCLNDSKVRLSRATFTPQQVFDLLYAFTDREVSYRDQFARSLVGRAGEGVAIEIAKKGETLYSPMVLRPASEAIVGGRADEVRLFTGCLANGATALGTAEDFSTYITRAIANSTNLRDDLPVSFNPDLTLAGLQSELETAIPVPTTFAMNDILDLSPGGEVGSQRSATVSPDGSGGMYNVGTFGWLAANATRCVMKHQMRLTLMDHIKIGQLPQEERVGALLAVRMNIAQLSTELLYRFLKEKLMFAQLDMQNGGSVSSRRATPPHVLASLETLVKIIEGQIETMQTLKSSQHTMSGLLSNIRSVQ